MWLRSIDNELRYYAKGGIMFNKKTWESALKERNQDSEDRFARGEKLTYEDIVVMALAYPDDFECLIREKKGT